MSLIAPMSPFQSFDFGTSEIIPYREEVVPVGDLQLKDKLAFDLSKQIARELAGAKATAEWIENAAEPSDLTESSEETVSFAQVIDLPKIKPAQRPQSRLVALQEWEGYVADITNDTFTAKLVDKSSSSTEITEFAEFDLEEVAPRDLGLFREGAVFNWIIGYETSPKGVKKKVSFLYFRRLPTFSEADLRGAKHLASALLDVFDDKTAFAHE